MEISTKTTSKLECEHKLFLHVNKISQSSADVVSKWDREGCKETETATGRKGGTPLPFSPVTCPLEHGTMQYSSSASQPVSQPGSQSGRIHPKGAPRSSPLNLLHNRTALSRRVLTDPCLSNSAVTIKIWSEGGLLANPPTHSKSKCAIKNAHLTSSSRLPNAYASYLRDQEEWYCKRYRIPFIRYTIQIPSGRSWWVFSPHATVQTEPWESVKQIQDLLKGTHLDAG